MTTRKPVFLVDTAGQPSSGHTYKEKSLYYPLQGFSAMQLNTLTVYSFGLRQHVVKAGP